jgi:hypothetical protein
MAKQAETKIEDHVQFDLPTPMVPELPFVKVSNRWYINEDILSNFSKNNTGFRLGINGEIEIGNIKLANVDLGGRKITINHSKSIQDAINNLPDDGGIIYLESGTYVLQDDIIGRSGLTIQGESESTTILDFDSNNKSFKFEGTDVYTTGTITSIAYNGGAGAFEVTGNGTSWLANASAGQYIFLGTRWYPIAAVTSNTTLLLAEGFSDTTPTNYRIATIKNDININNITIKNSAGTGFVATDVKNIAFEEVILLSNNVGASLTNCDLIQINKLQAVNSTSDGIQMTNCGLSVVSSMPTVNNGGNGVTLNNLKTISFAACASSGNTGDGVNGTSLIECLFAYACEGNGGQGIEITATSDRLFIQNSFINGNTSDGIKLTATTDSCIISNNQVINNGGYGINIAANTCDDNIIVDSYFNNNTSGNVNDAGTGTLLRSNIPITVDSPYREVFIPSDVLRASADTERTKNTIAYTKVKEIQVFLDGEIRVKFDLAQVNANATYSVSARIYVNAVAVGTERSITNNTSYTTFSEDIDVEEGDLVQLYYSDSGEGQPNDPQVKIRNFRIYYDKEFDVETNVITN